MPSSRQRGHDQVALIEREAELERIEALLGEAAAGRGSTLLIEGAPGIGKTALVESARELAGERGFTELSARAAELERELAFGVVRQLFGPLLRKDGAGDRRELLQGAARLAAAPLGIAGESAADDSPAPGSTLHGLYWLCANLCDRGPLLLVVDDLHWADEASLRAVSYLGRRAGEHPLLICAASRPPPPEPDGRAALAALGDGVAQVLHPGPLSAGGVEQLVRSTLGDAAESEFCAACTRASGGNPFLLAEAIAALRADGIPPDAAEAKRVERLRPETVSRALLARLARLGPASSASAHALAVLGAGAPLRRLAELAQLEPEAVAAAIDGLRGEGILAAGDRLEFAHPLIRNAVEADIASPARGLAHLRAARLLDEEGEAVGRIASHLLVAEPSADPWVVEVLGSAAGDALAAGAPEPAVAYLERALAEPPERSERSPLEAALGRALARAGRSEEGAGRLRRAFDAAAEPETRAALALELGEMLFVARQQPAALAVFEQARSALGGRQPELALRLETEIAFMRHAILEPAPEVLARLEAALERADPASPAGRTVQALLAYFSACAGSRTASEVARLATSAAEVSPSRGEGFLLLPFAAAALALADRTGAAIELFDRGIEAAVSSGDEPRFSFLLSFRSRTMLEAGRAPEAEADARAGLDAYATGAASLSHALAVLLNALVARGELEQAQEALEAHPEVEREHGLFPFSLFLWTRGRLRHAQGRPREALEDLGRCGETMTRIGSIPPANVRWRGDAALAHLALGEVEPARRLAAEELEQARASEVPREIGIALRTLGLVEGGERGIELLTESVVAFDRSDALLERGGSLVELGAALRRAGSRRQAREPLRAGLDLATRCGAPPLAERARQELVAAGGRPRRAALSGPGSLTPSELRVCRLAAEGRSNREIAQALFVTRRTVEVHLTSAYRKLEIDSRQGLEQALDPDGGAAQGSESGERSPAAEAPPAPG